MERWWTPIPSPLPAPSSGTELDYATRGESGMPDRQAPDFSNQREVFLSPLVPGPQNGPAGPVNAQCGGQKLPGRDGSRP